eukprot:4356630-Pyramimonas_sp.AAC.1
MLQLLEPPRQSNAIQQHRPLPTSRATFSTKTCRVQNCGQHAASMPATCATVARPLPLSGLAAQTY